MTNPFKYSEIVSGQSFCNRTQEQEDLLGFIKNSQNVLIHSHRRTGKSSLINQVFQNIKKQELDIGMVYVDLFGTTSEKDFVAKAFQKLGSLESNMEKMLNILKKAAKSFSVQFGVDPFTNQPIITPVPVSNSENDDGLPLKNLMDIFERFSKDRRLVVVFDEFQDVTEYAGSDSFEKRLRGFIQTHKNICYIFSGSRKHIITAMFQSNARAFYNQAASFSLKEISSKHYVAWLKKLFAGGKNKMTTNDLMLIVNRFENHPMYIQFFCYFLYEELQHSPWDESLMEKIEDSILKNKKAEFQVLWGSLPKNQRKTLKLVIIKHGKGLFAGDMSRLVEIKTASIVSQCLKALCEKDVLIKEDKYVFQDLLFQRWLARKL